MNFAINTITKVSVLNALQNISYLLKLRNVYKDSLDAYIIKMTIAMPAKNLFISMEFAVIYKDV